MKVLIPLVRKVMPSLVAQQIVGVQPMSNVYVGGHSFNLKYWPHVKMVAWNQLFDAERWCYNNFKSRNWRNQGQFFAFKRERDLMLFVLVFG